MSKQQTFKTSIKLDGSPEITLSTGLLAPQAGGAVTARCGDTIILATVTSSKPREGMDFLPLTVEYRDKLYAGGIIKSSRFVKREGRPSDENILTSRLIDRSLRPLFNQDYRGDLQIIITPLSVDGVHEPEILGIIAASAAVSISPIPFAGPVGAVRVGHKDKFIANPTQEDQEGSDIDLVVAGNKASLTMIEAGTNEVSEKVLGEGLDFANTQLNKVIKAITEMTKAVGKDKLADPEETIVSDEVKKLVKGKLGNLDKLAKSWALKTGNTPDDIASEIINDLPEDSEIEPSSVYNTAFKLVKEHIRANILKNGTRADGRSLTAVRSIDIKVGLLPRTHGSALFQRGLTHALSIITLGSPGKEQLLESMTGETTKRYFHHYNMPPYSVGESGRLGFPKRREIGHGALAERALAPVLPAPEDFPYTIRVVTEIMSGNGSTSQAAICGSSLSLMDAGVPLKKPVAGIAMGLITDGKGKTVTLSDISGVEDYIGDMDFKVAGTKDGITAIQMDVKTLNITPEVLKSALSQAKEGRLHILKEMAKTIESSRPDTSPLAPRIESVTINPEKIGTVIGPGGKTIRGLQDELGVEIDIDDDGIVSISGTDGKAVLQAKQRVQDLTAEAEVGKIYQGTVKRVQSFGAFVEIIPGMDGLVHVSRMGKDFVKDAADVLKEGQVVEVKVYEIDSQGRINLTMLVDDSIQDSKAKGQRSGGNGGNRGGQGQPQGRSPRPHQGRSRFSSFNDSR